MSEWRPVAGYEGLYEVSNCGEIRSLDHYATGAYGKVRLYPGKKLKPTKDRKGYLYLDLCKNGKRRKHKVHRLVAQAFIPNPNSYSAVNHIDHVVDNNRVDNLEWCTDEYNNADHVRWQRTCKQDKRVI